MDEQAIYFESYLRVVQAVVQAEGPISFELSSLAAGSHYKLEANEARTKERRKALYGASLR